jgi:hypothetical protein
MIKIHQIQLTKNQIDAVNAGEKVAAFDAKNTLSLFAMPSQFKTEWFNDFFDVAFEVDTDDLNKAFEWTNLWNNQPAVDVIGDRNHSSSVGDVFELNGEFFLCAAFGFEQLTSLTSGMSRLKSLEAILDAKVAA